MAVNSSRSQNADLNEGATDGLYRKDRPNTAVSPWAGDTETKHARSHLHPWWGYGYVNSVVPLADRAIPGRFDSSTPHR